MANVAKLSCLGVPRSTLGLLCSSPAPPASPSTVRFGPSNLRCYDRCWWSSVILKPNHLRGLGERQEGFHIPHSSRFCILEPA
ncbi:hypothetical protein P691DRAFT_397763 [Macrolepiota fuliginosa MF-IS2]|uniref:Uncharacterized protein n=1 Tax=Macrolepiota fuliginosa MF-IS2 TaxID=1400762 RepID=A0A9P5XPP2_9AGAR|nr:hypothetical protein P691DRAFT_397763 [Macrolepiota fuliginosa MF-IS2]